MGVRRLLTLVALASLAACASAEEASATPKPDASSLEPAVGEAMPFQSDVSRLLDLIINNLYSRTEVFLRELISNGSDALDKIRFLSLSNDTELGEGETRNLELRITFDAEARTLTVRDRGVGMTKADLIANLGTIAKSGTAAFAEQLSATKDVSLIGQFGVGFYSAYLAADRVRVTSKHNADTQHIWDSTADGSFTIAADPAGDTLGRGTEIKLYLKPDAGEYANEDHLRKLIRKYSEFITFPIYLEVSKVETVEVPVATPTPAAAASPADASATAAPAASAAAPADDEELVAAEDESASPSAAPAPAMKNETRTVKSWEVVNDQKAIWHRAPKNITDDEYAAFFRVITKDPKGSPHTWIHFTAEGELEFRSILYIPDRAAGDIYDNYYAKTSSLRLYVRKVLISDEFEELMPRYLNFIRGVVDSDDLPLNVSREQLQQSKLLRLLGKKLVRKVLEMVRGLALDEKKAGDAIAAGKNATAADGEDGLPLRAGAERAYTKFWELYGKNIKLGVIEDAANRSRLAKLLRYRTSKAAPAGTPAGNATWRSLDDYVRDLAPGQKLIYYIAGESLDAVASSPFLEQLRARGLEVLYMTDPIDEYTVQNLPEYEGHRLQSISKEGFHMPGDDKAEKKREALYAENLKPLTDYLTKVLAGKVEKVAISARLASTPCVLVTSQYGYSANLERIMKAQAFADPSKSQFLASRKTLEINPRHPLIARLREKALADKSAINAETRDLVNILYDAALLNSGFTIDDAKEFSARIFRILKTGLALDSLDLLPEIAVPEDPVEAAAEDDEEEEEEEEEAEEEEEEEHSEL